MPAATALPDPLDRDHLARLVGRASELRRSLAVVAERIATRHLHSSGHPRNKVSAPGDLPQKPR